MQFIYSDMIGLQQKAKRHHNGAPEFSFSFIDISHFYLFQILPVSPVSLALGSLFRRKMQLIPCRHNPRALISCPCSAFPAPTLGLPTETVGTCQVTPCSQPETPRGLIDAHWVNLWSTRHRSWSLHVSPSFFWMDRPGYPEIGNMITHPHICSALHPSYDPLSHSCFPIKLAQFAFDSDSPL